MQPCLVFLTGMFQRLSVLLRVPFSVLCQYLLYSEMGIYRDNFLSIIAQNNFDLSITVIVFAIADKLSR